MRRAVTIILAVISLGLIRGPANDPHDDLTTRAIPTPVRFTSVDIYIDPNGRPLAAYQFELTAQGADATLVGVEGGEHQAFAQPPYYDPRANLNKRIVIAAFNTGEDLPRQRTRVATVMLRVKGAVPPRFSATLQVAADASADPIHAGISVSEGAQP